MPPMFFLDGGLGTSLEKNHNVKFDGSTPLWSSDLLVSDPQTLFACQRAFGLAPVDIILTATYQVSILAFANTKNSSSARGVHKEGIPGFLDQAVAIAERAKAPGACVALSIGPYGACMTPSQEYSGLYDLEHDSQDALREWHLERLQLFAQIPRVAHRVRYLALETIPRVDEIAAMRQALEQVPELAALPFWMSSLFPGDCALPDETPAGDVLRAMLSRDVARIVPWGVGVNCTKVWKLDGILRQYEAAISEMVSQDQLQEWPALVLYPDGTNGEVYNTATKKWEVPSGVDASHRVPWETQLAEVVRQTDSRGQWRQIVVGGCCMAGPEDIKKLRHVLSAE